ncbi:MAG: THUMP domain-containing protein [Promethearchaeati archaeon SRVP18_Atabeyarchaeia-1]
MDLPVVLVRFNEIALKSKRTRSALRGLLRHNILAALKMNVAVFNRIEDTWERLIIHTNESEKAANASSRVFGVASASPATECVSEIDTISRIVSDMAGETLENGNSFAIRVRRVGKHGFTTNEVAVRCGSSVIETLKRSGAKIKVNLDSPDHEFFVEIREGRTFIYTTVIRGVGGLPLGSQGKVVSQLDDYESILAVWMMMKRGCMPILVQFDPESGELISTAKSSLRPYVGADLPVIEVPLGKAILEANKNSPLQECLKYLIMIEIARLQSAHGIVSSRRLDPSDASQIELIRKYVGIADFPVFYPLVGFDSIYLRSLAERIGGSALSSKIGDKCYSIQESKEDSDFNATCEPDSIARHYQEKIRELVMTALARVEPDA